MQIVTGNDADGRREGRSTGESRTGLTGPDNVEGRAVVKGDGGRSVRPRRTHFLDAAVEICLEAGRPHIGVRGIEQRVSNGLLLGLTLGRISKRDAEAAVRLVGVGSGKRDVIITRHGLTGCVGLAVHELGTEKHAGGGGDVHMGDDGLTVAAYEIESAGGIVVFKTETGIELTLFTDVENIAPFHVHDVIHTDIRAAVGTGMNEVALVFRNGLQEVAHLVGRDDETLVGGVNGDEVDIPIGNKVIARNLQKARIVETEKIILVLGNETGAGGNLGRRDEQPSVHTGYEGVTGVTAHRDELGVDDAALRDGAMNMILRIGIQGNRLHKFSHFQTPELWFMPLSWSCSSAKGQACAWPTLSLT